MSFLSVAKETTYNAPTLNSEFSDFVRECNKVMKEKLCWKTTPFPLQESNFKMEVILFSTFSYQWISWVQLPWKHDIVKEYKYMEHHLAPIDNVWKNDVANSSGKNIQFS